MLMYHGARTRKLYICTSTSNIAAYRQLQQALELAPYEVQDWTRFLPKPGPDFDQRKNEDPHGAAFAYCSRALGGSDLVVYLWPTLGGLAVAVALYGLVLGGTAVLSTRSAPVR